MQKSMGMCVCMHAHVCVPVQACPYLESDLTSPATYYKSLRKGGNPVLLGSAIL